jgi:hypothetical protein
MLIVETIGRIRREHFVKGKTIKEIVRDLGISRNTVRKALRSEETSFGYGRDTQPLPKLGPWSKKLDDLLGTNAKKLARERLTLIRVFEDLRGLGYEGGYDAVRRYARDSWRWARFSGLGATSLSGSEVAAPATPYAFSPCRRNQLSRRWARFRIARADRSSPRSPRAFAAMRKASARSIISRSFAGWASAIS